MSEPEGPKPPSGWFIDRLKALQKEAEGLRDDAVRTRSPSEIATWTAVAAFLALAVLAYRA